LLLGAGCCLLLLQALGLTLTFGAANPGAQAVVMTLLCMLFGYAHCLVLPMREPAAQYLQSVLLFCLGVVALSATPFASVLESAVTAGVTASSSPAGTLASRCVCCRCVASCV
jgi:hypothetical protein